MPASDRTFAIGGVSRSAVNFVVIDSFVLRINICSTPIINLQNVNQSPQRHQKLSEQHLLPNTHNVKCV